MQCPVCDVTLSISGREGVEIDFCPQCRGVWLDRGELDKIIERNAALGGAAPAPAPPRYDEPRRGGDRYESRERHDDRDRYDDRSPRRKKRSFLEDIFDLD